MLLNSRIPCSLLIWPTTMFSCKIPNYRVLDQRFFEIYHVIAGVKVILHQNRWLRWFHLCTSYRVRGILLRRARVVTQVVVGRSVIVLQWPIIRVVVLRFQVNQRVGKGWCRHCSQWTKHAPSTRRSWHCEAVIAARLLGTQIIPIILVQMIILPELILIRLVTAGEMQLGVVLLRW